jgi:uncharacterized protein
MPLIQGLIAAQDLPETKAGAARRKGDAAVCFKRASWVTAGQSGGRMNRVVHFELGAVDPARAVEFYKNVFGWQAQKWGEEEYWLMKTGSTPDLGIDGAILRNKDSQPRTVNSISVRSIEEFAARVEQHGGKVVVPKTTIPTVGYLAYCNDTEGNIFGIFQSDGAAK